MISGISHTGVRKNRGLALLEAIIFLPVFLIIIGLGLYLEGYFALQVRAHQTARTLAWLNKDASILPLHESKPVSPFTTFDNSLSEVVSKGWDVHENEDELGTVDAVYAPWRRGQFYLDSGHMHSANESRITSKHSSFALHSVEIRGRRTTDLEAILARRGDLRVDIQLLNELGLYVTGWDGVKAVVYVLRPRLIDYDERQLN